MPFTTFPIPSAELSTVAAAARAGLGIYNSVKAINVKTDYGATGDGSTNDTTAIQNAITAAQAGGGGRVVYFPEGTYKCNLTVTGNVWLVGAGGGPRGAWSTASGAAPSMLIPNSNASPIIDVSSMKDVHIQGLELRGNGAGVTTSGLKATSPGGLYLYHVTIRACTYNYHSVGACNVQATQCGFYQGTANAYFVDTSYAHSNLFQLCDFGGTPVSGSGRCIEVASGGPFITLINCEQGNCTDYFYAPNGTAPQLTVVGSNWETFSGSTLIQAGLSSITLMGGRLGVSGKTIYKTDQAGYFSMTGMVGTSGQYIDHVGTANLSIRNCAPVTIREYTAGFASLTGEGLSSPAIVRARLTSTQNCGAAGTYTVIFNSVVFNQNSKYDNTTGIFKPGKAGYYQVNASLRVSTVAGGEAQLKFFINNSEALVPAYLTAGSAGTTLCGAGLVYLDANDELDIRLRTGGACDLQVGGNNSTTLSIIEIPSS